MKKEFTEAELIAREFLRVARVILEYWEEGRGDTRLLDWLISDNYVVVGESINGKGRREHVVPRKYIYDQCERMFEQNKNIDEVATFIRNFLKIIHVTPEEAKKMDGEPGLKTGMPTGWNFENGDPFARLTEAKIQFKLYGH